MMNLQKFSSLKAHITLAYNFWSSAWRLLILSSFLLQVRHPSSSFRLLSAISSNEKERMLALVQVEFDASCLNMLLCNICVFVYVCHVNSNQIIFVQICVFNCLCGATRRHILHFESSKIFTYLQKGSLLLLQCFFHPSIQCREHHSALIEV